MARYLQYRAMLSNFNNEENFRKAVFDGKTDGEDLDKTDVQRILSLRLPFIGWANSH